MEYLEERYPEPALLAADAADRALARLWIFRHDDFTTPVLRAAPRRGRRSGALRRSSSRGSTRRSPERPWLGGAEYGLADIAYVPWVLRARDMLGVALDGHPALAAWLDAAGRASGDRGGGAGRCGAVGSAAML